MRRVTVGVRLGLSSWESRQAVPEHISDDPAYSSGIPVWVEPEVARPNRDISLDDTALMPVYDAG